jgi:ribosomal RNA-processing protein 7
MTAFADQEASRARALARQRAEPDEDGFVTVTRGGRMGPARQEEAQEKAELEGQGRLLQVPDAREAQGEG